MASAETRRHQHFYRLADQLFARVTEQLLGARIGGAHDAVPSVTRIASGENSKSRSMPES
jgi:hypothetical protein